MGARRTWQGVALGMWSRALAAYNASLTRRPLATNIAASVVISFVGDFAAQTLVERRAPSEYDASRGAELAAVRVFFVVPVLARWYPFLRRVFPGTTLRATLGRVAMDQLLWAPTFCVAFFAAIPALRGEPAERSVQNVRENLWPTLRINWMMWPAIQTFNFRFVAPQHQILLTNVASVAWSAVLSYVAKPRAPKPAAGLYPGEG